MVPYSKVGLRLEDLACLSHLTRLTGLRLDGSTLAQCVAGSSVLVSLTGLVSLGICGASLGMSLLSKVNLKAVKWRLSLEPVNPAEDNGADVAHFGLGQRWGRSST